MGITSLTCRHCTHNNSIMCSNSYPIPILSLFFFCSLTSSNYKGADAAVFAVPRPHRTGMSIIQELTPYPRGYEYFPGSGQATMRPRAVCAND